MGEVGYARTTDDLVGMYRDLFVATIRRKPWRRAARIGAALALMVGLGWMLDHDSSGSGSLLYAAAIGLLIALALCWGTAWLPLPRRARRLFAQDRTVDPRWTWRWSEEALEGCSANADYHYR